MCAIHTLFCTIYIPFSAGKRSKAARAALPELQAAYMKDFPWLRIETEEAEGKSVVRFYCTHCMQAAATPGCNIKAIERSAFATTGSKDTQVRFMCWGWRSLGRCRP